MSIDEVLATSDSELFTTQISSLKITSPQMLGRKTVYGEVPLIDLLEVFEGCFHISAKYPPIKTLVNSAIKQTELINHTFGWDLSRATLRSWKYVENPSLPNLIRFFQVHSIDIDKTWKEISLKSRGSPWIKLARYVPFDENFAYVIGALLADRGHKQEISIIDMDLEILKEFVERLCPCFPLKKSDFFVYVHALEQPSSEFLNHVSAALEIPIPKIKVIKKSPSKCSPTIYFRVGVRNAIVRAIVDYGIAFVERTLEKMPPKVKASLLGGLLNGEGSIYKGRYSWILGFECYDQNVLTLAKTLIKELKVKIFPSKTKFCLILKSKWFIKELLKIPIVGEKKKKLMQACDEVRASLCMDDIVREFCNSEFTARDVADKFQISYKRANQFIVRLIKKKQAKIEGEKYTAVNRDEQHAIYW
ncbi:MAG: hypothetical protein ACE5OT_00580 [Candidatus Hadarchaeaceae archaeon]